MRPTEPLIDRVMRYVEFDTNGGCWLWRGATLGNAGYGNVPIKGRPTSASRASWIAHFGDVPEGMVVCHKCDVRLCCNPSHLFLGSQAENVRDMVSKGRANPARGSASAKAKLTEESVRRIRQLSGKESIRAIGRRFGVDPMTIHAVLKGKTWRHVTSDDLFGSVAA